MIVEGHADKLQTIADLLLERETIEGEELEALFETPRPRPDRCRRAAAQGGVRAGNTGGGTTSARGERDAPGARAARPQPAD